MIRFKLILSSTILFTSSLLLLVVVASSVQAQTFRFPKLLGFYDMSIEDRCMSSKTTIDPNGYVNIPVIGRRTIAMTLRTHGKQETLNLFSSHPYLLDLPSSVEIGEGRENAISFTVKAVDSPTLVTIRAKVAGDFSPGFADIDTIMIYPRFEVESIRFLPEKEVYQVGDRITVRVNMNQAQPDGVQILRPIIGEPKFGLLDPIFMGGADWSNDHHATDIYMNSDRRSFEHEFTVEWPEEEPFISSRQSTAEFRVPGFVDPPRFCPTVGRSSIEGILEVRNPNYRLIPERIKRKERVKEIKPIRVLKTSK